MSNEERIPVFIRDLIESSEFQELETQLPCIIGKDIYGKTVVADIAKMPHLLVAGCPESALIKQIVDFLRGDFTFVPSLADRLDDVEKRLIRLTAEQARIMEALSENDHLMINGNAGTGKTVLATNFAMQKATQGKRVLYLTFNKNLAQSLLTKAGKALGQGEECAG